MPYIEQEDRAFLCKLMFNILQFDKLTAGDLNYCITKLLLAQEPKRYEDYNRLIGVLECVKLEFYRRAVALYEDMKIKENGDVYEKI